MIYSPTTKAETRGPSTSSKADNTNKTSTESPSSTTYISWLLTPQLIAEIFTIQKITSSGPQQHPPTAPADSGRQPPTASADIRHQETATPPPLAAPADGNPPQHQQTADTSRRQPPTAPADSRHQETATPGPLTSWKDEQRGAREAFTNTLTKAGHAIACWAGRCGRHLLCPLGALKSISLSFF